MLARRLVLLGCRLQKPLIRNLRLFAPLQQANISIDEIVGQIEKLDVITPFNKEKVHYDNIDQIISILRSSDDTNSHAVSDDVRRDRLNQIKTKIGYI
jgi:Mg2+/Co2+ transporter CorB